MRTYRILLPAVLSAICLIFYFFFSVEYFHPVFSGKNHQTQTLRPWQCVGGCGVVSGGGATGGAVARWIGRGVTGTLVDAEIQAGTKFEMDDGATGTGAQESRLLNIKLLGHLAKWDLCAALPLNWKIKGSGNLAGGGTQIGGIGDLNFDVIRKWGSQGQLRTSANLLFPTGKADVFINKNKILPQSLQNGRGNYALSGILDYTIDLNNGFWLLGGGYSAGLFYNKPVAYEYDMENVRINATRYQIAWAHSNLASKNDMQAVTADFASLFVNLAVKQQKVVHGFGVSLGIPMADNGYTEFLFQGRVPLTIGTSQQSAQTYADTVMTLVGWDTLGKEIHSLKYHHPQILTQAYDSTGGWVVREEFFHPQKMYPEFVFTYSLELMAVDNFPMLFALSWPIRLGAGRNALYGFAVTGGLKIPVF
jgi:hypothetical protein